MIQYYSSIAFDSQTTFHRGRRKRLEKTMPPEQVRSQFLSDKQKQMKNSVAKILGTPELATKPDDFMLVIVYRDVDNKEVTEWIKIYDDHPVAAPRK
jgi:hypothetical protein